MFGLQPKKTPKIRTKDYVLKYSQKHGEWQLEYKNIEFCFPSPEINLPNISAMDVYLSWIDKHQEHIDKEVKEMAAGWDDVFVDASKSHVASITVESNLKILVMILGDDTWGDLGYDIWFENGKIVNEGFAD